MVSDDCKHASKNITLVAHSGCLRFGARFGISAGLVKADGAVNCAEAECDEAVGCICAAECDVPVACAVSVGYDEAGGWADAEERDITAADGVTDSPCDGLVDGVAENLDGSEDVTTVPPYAAVANNNGKNEE